jgi:hypothetical protein
MYREPSDHTHTHPSNPSKVGCTLRHCKMWKTHMLAHNTCDGPMLWIPSQIICQQTGRGRTYKPSGHLATPTSNLMYLGHSGHRHAQSLGYHWKQLKHSMAMAGIIVQQQGQHLRPVARLTANNPNNTMTNRPHWLKKAASAFNHCRGAQGLKCNPSKRYILSQPHKGQCTTHHRTCHQPSLHQPRICPRKDVHAPIIITSLHVLPATPQRV